MRERSSKILETHANTALRGGFLTLPYVVVSAFSIIIKVLGSDSWTLKSKEFAHNEGLLDAKVYFLAMSWTAIGCILAVLGHRLDSAWLPLGRAWTPPGQRLAASSPLLDTAWTAFGCLLAALGQRFPQIGHAFLLLSFLHHCTYNAFRPHSPRHSATCYHLQPLQCTHLQPLLCNHSQALAVIALPPLAATCIHFTAPTCSLCTATARRKSSASENVWT